MTDLDRGRGKIKLASVLLYLYAKIKKNKKIKMIAFFLYPLIKYSMTLDWLPVSPKGLL